MNRMVVMVYNPLMSMGSLLLGPTSWLTQPHWVKWRLEDGQTLAA